MTRIFSWNVNGIRACAGKGLFEWLAAESPDVLVLHYDDFCADPATTLLRLLAHSGLPRSREECQAALDAVWSDRAGNRYNKGVSGRGGARFTPSQIARLERQLDFYPDLAGMKATLIPPPSASLAQPSAAA